MSKLKCMIWLADQKATISFYPNLMQKKLGIIWGKGNFSGLKYVYRYER